MYKLTVTYKNFDGDDVTEDVRLHVTNVQLLRLESKYGNGLKAEIEDIVNTNDRSRMLAFLEDLVQSSYGVRKGDLFVQDEETKKHFLYTNLYPETLMALLSSETSIAAFFNTIPGLENVDFLNGGTSVMQLA